MIEGIEEVVVEGDLRPYYWVLKQKEIEVREEFTLSQSSRKSTFKPLKVSFASHKYCAVLLCRPVRMTQVWYP